MSHSIEFTKMHGLGNDFVIIHTDADAAILNHLDIPKLAHRHTGIGFDQLLIITPSDRADFYCHIFNADGSEASQCGNGLRCIARFVHEEGLHTDVTLTVATKAGVFPILIKDYDHIQIEMGLPQIENENFKLSVPLSDHHIETTVLSLGNPHAIIKVNSIDTIDMTLGAAISSHPYFVDGVNVGFMEVIHPQKIRLRTFERGVGETFACGSNACASVATGIQQGWLKSPATVELPFGSLLIEWTHPNVPIHMTGPAVKVFRGSLNQRNE